MLLFAGAVVGWALRRLAPPPPPATLRVAAARLEAFTAAVLEACGVVPEDAAEAARLLILADVRGIDSHGIARLKAYFTLLRRGTVNPRPRVRVVRETASTATVDGDNGLGLVVGPKANRIAMDKAAAAGSGWVAVRNTHHYGIAGYYSLEALKRGMIGFSMTNTSAVVAPLGGRRRMLGTNPLAVAFPGLRQRPVVIDMATSVVPWGRVEEHARTGRPLLPGWAIDADGAGARDAERVLAAGALVGLGGHKGYCLAAMVDILCGVLSGGNWGPHVGGFTTRALYGAGEPAAGAQAVGIGHFFGALSIAGFREPAEFGADVDAWRAAFAASEPAVPGAPVLVPGDPEWAAEAARRREGVPVKVSVLADLLEVATQSGVPPPFDPAGVDLSGGRAVQVIL